LPLAKPRLPLIATCSFSLRETHFRLRHRLFLKTFGSNQKDMISTIRHIEVMQLLEFGTRLPDGQVWRGKKEKEKEIGNSMVKIFNPCRM